MALEIVNERSTAYLTVSFYDRNGVLVAPTGVTYRVDDLASGQNIRTSTSVTPASTVVVTLDTNDNQVLTAANPYETRVVTVLGTYGASDQATARFQYLVRNLQFHP